MSVRILQGNVMDRLKELPDESVHCVVTSPPYWGLRSYLADGHPDKIKELGCERTLGEHIAKMVSVFNEVRRVMRKDATLWLNYGDCYATSPSGNRGAGDGSRGRIISGGYLKPKDLCMVPNRIAIALQENGWWVRSEIIWAKPNPMPESVVDRPSSAHEKIWLLTKSAKYFYDAEAVRRPAAECSVERIKYPRTPASKHFGKSKDMKGTDGARLRPDKQRGHGRTHAGFNERWDAMPRDEQISFGANLRNVWTVATSPFPEAHFATFPADLIEPCIKAGCPKDGVVLDPFAGAGTTGLVASRLGRNAILIELNPEYVRMAERRLKNDTGMFSQVEVIA